MGNISILKAKIKDDHFLTVVFEEHLEKEVVNTITRESTAPVHDDMIQAFKKLEPHFAYICEEIGLGLFLTAIGEELPPGVTVVQPNGGVTEKAMEDLFGMKPEETDPMEKFLVTGFNLARKGDYESVMLIGRKYLKNGSMVNMNSPSTKMDVGEYHYASELAEVVERCKYEILEFLTNGKQAPAMQPEFPFGEEQKTEVTSGVSDIDWDDEPQPKKKRGRQKSKPVAVEEEAGPDIGDNFFDD